MPTPIAGLHHVTTIASDPQRNLDFYTRVLGLRLVKKTINFDDPGTYHLYFGDDHGSPGTILTFFPWPNAVRGTLGAGETAATAFSVPTASLGYWRERLQRFAVPLTETHHFAEDVLRFQDPDGMVLEIVGDAQAKEPVAPRGSDVPAEHSIRGFYGVTLLVHLEAPTAGVLDTMGLEKTAEEGERKRYSTRSGALGSHVDLLVDPKAARGRLGAGTVHHIAFRAADDAAQAAWRERLSAHPLEVTPVLDRTYFHSIYFREPGGVLFEMATDPPGFAWDESLETMGESLKLPPWLETRRAALETSLPRLTVHPAGDAVVKTEAAGV
ncbi:ring-cleaving dioxygenase [Acidipila sp. EB88]|uniref:ring-cleaving dioxygenase n=1 Tax=Acidipila sp. EB88 TaxID=2305226 RepID=UPI000F5E0801|nr:ring-cleaving dioxygenase [Acidipila sp. EB88]RRA47957.1 ring-cleaving dioxygenase [Acidipila sp. EB88]